MKKSIIIVYLILNIISTYHFEERLNVLILSQIFMILFFLFSLNNIIKENKINSKIFLIVVAIVSSSFFNYKEISKYFINIASVLSSYYIVKDYKKNGKNMTDLILQIITVFTILNFLLIMVLPGIKGNSKEIFGLTISRSSSQYLGLAIASINAGLALVYAKKYKSKIIKYLVTSISVIIIINSGKLSVILTLILIWILKELYLKIGKKISIKISQSIIILFFMGNFIYLKSEVYLKKYINVERILTGRVILWRDYSEYILNRGNLIFGNGFFESEKIISYLSHPHNNYVGIIYTLGIFGAVVYFLFFSKTIENMISKLDKSNDYILMILMFILFIMNTDDYFLLTVYPIYNLIFIDNLIKE